MKRLVRNSEEWKAFYARGGMPSYPCVMGALIGILLAWCFIWR